VVGHDHDRLAAPGDQFRQFTRHPAGRRSRGPGSPPGIRGPFQDESGPWPGGVRVDPRRSKAAFGFRPHGGHSIPCP
jgi:hypothetical protein